MSVSKINTSTYSAKLLMQLNFVGARRQTPRKSKKNNAKFTFNFWRKISFKVREMPYEKGNSSVHLSRVLVYIRVGLWQFFCRKTKFVSFVLQKSLIPQREGNTDLLNFALLWHTFDLFKII